MTWKLPSLAECQPQIEPSEFKVLCAMAEFQDKTAGGILLTQDTREREAFRAATGRLIAVSPHAFSYAAETAWSGREPQVGDVVFLGKFPGEEVEGADGRTYRLCSDREIGAVLERAAHIASLAAE